MLNKISEILTSWYSSFNPSEEAKEKAESRASICDECPHKVELDSAILTTLTANDKLLNKFKCGKCGCPLAKKIFSPFTTSCPLNKWVK